MKDDDVMKIFKNLPGNVIPYRKEFRKIVGTVNASILWQQLEYWFDKMGKPIFYKFLSPVDGEDFGYKKGDSWVEELGFSECEFRGAFKKLGAPYKSKKEYLEQKDPYKGKMYCSYINKIERRTYYLRNAKKVKANLVRLKNSISRCEDESSTELRKDVPSKLENKSSINTENTAKNTQENNSEYSFSETSSERKSGKKIINNKKKNSEKKDRKTKTATGLTKSEGMVFRAYSKYVHGNYTENTKTIREGIPRAIKIFKRIAKNENMAAEMLVGVIERYASTDWFKKNYPENPIIFSPKIFFSTSSIENSLIPLIPNNQNTNGRVPDREISDKELRQISKDNKRRREEHFARRQRR